MRYLVLLSIFVLSSCSENLEIKRKYPKSKDEIMENRVGTLTKNGIFSTGAKSNPFSSKSDAITVSAYLWRASLDSITFMPLASTDPFGGVIITDWYSDEGSNERYKVNIIIYGYELRDDLLNVRVYKEKRNKQGNWSNQFSDDSLADSIKEIIMKKARILKVHGHR